MWCNARQRHATHYDVAQQAPSYVCTHHIYREGQLSQPHRNSSMSTDRRMLLLPPLLPPPMPTASTTIQDHREQEYDHIHLSTDTGQGYRRARHSTTRYAMRFLVRGPDKSRLVVGSQRDRRRRDARRATRDARRGRCAARRTRPPRDQDEGAAQAACLDGVWTLWSVLGSGPAAVLRRCDFVTEAWGTVLRERTVTAKRSSQSQSPIEKTDTHSKAESN